MPKYVDAENHLRALNGMMAALGMISVDLLGSAEGSLLGRPVGRKNSIRRVMQPAGTRGCRPSSTGLAVMFASWLRNAGFADTSYQVDTPN
jgi:hypothetical protein